MNNLFKIVLLIATAVFVVISAWYILHKTIVFHTDIARDFLLIEDIVKNKPLTLIGPRSGGIPGVFHGPLWLYINVPAYLVGSGNPVIVGWFWIGLSLVNLLIVYTFSLRFFKDKLISLFSVLLVASATVLDIRALYNPWGAVMLAPLFFYFFWIYNRYSHFKDLIISLFILGIIIQFQMAFGIPLLFLTLAYVVKLIIKTKRLKHILGFIILLLPLSTFILFDLKHQFIQSKAVINFASGRENFGKVDIKLFDLVDDRVRRAFADVPHFITTGKWYLMVPFLFLISTAIGKILSKKDKTEKSIYGLFLYFYLGYWFLTLFFKGQIWGYYYWPFLSVIAILFSSLYRYVDKRLFYFVFMGALVVNFINGVSHNIRRNDFFKEDGGSWSFYERVSDDVFTDADDDFGYFIFNPDQFGYSARYALHFQQQNFKNIKAYSFQKKRITYLIITPSDNPFLSVDGWKAGQVKLVKKPVKIKKYKDGVVVEKYELTPEEIEVQPDPNIIGATLLFR